MSGVAVVVVLVLAVLGGRAAEAKMPADLSRFLKLESQAEQGTALDNQAVDPIEEARIRLGLGDIRQYVPAPIDKVECHVEFQVTERVPGRCTKLAGSIPACQAEKYIGINYNECS